MKRTLIAMSIMAAYGLLGDHPRSILMASRRSRQRRDKRQPWDDEDQGR